MSCECEYNLTECNVNRNITWLNVMWLEYKCDECDVCKNMYLGAPWLKVKYRQSCDLQFV